MHTGFFGGKPEGKRNSEDRHRREDYIKMNRQA
jgi:hypothetical protein